MTKLNLMFKRFSKFFIILIIFVFLGWWIYSQLFVSLFKNSDEESIIFIVEQGEGLSNIASNLKNQGFINSRILFTSYIFLKRDEGFLQAGQYSLSPLMSVSQIAQKILKGETSENKITIIEGWNLKNIAEYLEDKEIIQKEDFLNITDSLTIFIEEFSYLNDKPIKQGLEGYLFPDTYSVKITDNAKDIIEMMLKNFDKKLTSDLRVEIEEQNKTIFEIIIMASLLEKEVRGEEDKKIVSGIFWKRIANKYPLQSCATIAYALGKDKWRYSIEDTKIDSPYNTYQRLGLPIGPICNPGLESIKAAISPEATKFWYYLSTPEGETIFSKTLREHNIATAKYLK